MLEKLFYRPNFLKIKSLPLEKRPSAGAPSALADGAAMEAIFCMKPDPTAGGLLLLASGLAIVWPKKPKAEVVLLAAGLAPAALPGAFGSKLLAASWPGWTPGSGRTEGKPLVRMGFRAVGPLSSMSSAVPLP